MRTKPILIVVFALLSGLAAGCSNKKDGPRLSDVVPTITGQLLDTLLGPPPQARSLTVPSDPPLLQRGHREIVLLTADDTAFVKALDGMIQADDVTITVRKVAEQLDKGMKRRRFSCRPVAFPAKPQPEEAARAVIAVATPKTLETGGPAEKAKGKSRVMLLIHMTLTDARTGEILAQREFYSGYELPKPKP